MIVKHNPEVILQRIREVETQVNVTEENEEEIVSLLNFDLEPKDE